MFVIKTFFAASVGIVAYVLANLWLISIMSEPSPTAAADALVQQYQQYGSPF
jgi:hypothetical protein